MACTVYRKRLCYAAELATSQVTLSTSLFYCVHVCWVYMCYLVFYL